MDNPVIAEVTRGGRVESVHRGTYAVIDGHGSVFASAGDTGKPIYPRSSMKMMQALPLIESGAADAFSFDDSKLALACSSHSAAPDHLSKTSDMLDRAGLSEPALACGAHWPLYRTEDVVTMARAGREPDKTHNTCSGKHAGFLAGCVHCDMPVETYVDPHHPWQREIRATLEAVCDCRIGEDETSSDGCNAPTYAMPLASLARGFQRLFSGQLVSADRAKAASRLAAACMKNPSMVAGEGRACTALMKAVQGQVFAKCGAEGLYVAGVPDLGIAMAMKCDDGSSRSVEVLVARLLADALAAHGRQEEAGALEDMTRQKVTTHRGDVVGDVRAVV